MTEEQEDQPDRRRHGYKELEQKLDDHAERIDSRVESFIRRALIAFAIVGLTSTGALVGFGVLVTKQGQTTSEIQAQRRDSIFRSCYEQNLRHDNTFKQLRAVAAEAVKKEPKRAAQIKQSTKSSLTIIEALVPKRDCVKLVKQSVDEG